MLYSKETYMTQKSALKMAADVQRALIRGLVAQGISYRKITGCLHLSSRNGMTAWKLAKT